MPLSNATMMVVPDLARYTEGGHLYLICSVEGTPPVTFKWFRADEESPVYVATSSSNNTDYQIPVLSRKHSGRYRCEAVNPANNIVSSGFVDIRGELTQFGFFRGRYFSFLFISILLWTFFCLPALIQNVPSHTKFHTRIGAGKKK